MGKGGTEITQISQWGYFTELADDLLITREGNKQETGTQPNAKNTFTYEGTQYTTLNSITTYGNADFNLTFNTVSYTVTIGSVLNFNRVTGTVKSTSVWNFGSNGAIVCANRKNNWGGAFEFVQDSTFTFNVDVTDEQLAGVSNGELYKRNLMQSLDETGNGIWNVTNDLELNATGLVGYENVGLITDVNQLQNGQYGFVVLNPASNDQFAGDGISFVFRAIPEPTTATLSFLALAGLAARRRRK